MKYKAIRGMEDILPENVRIWQELERIARRELESYGYIEIRTPILENTSIFIRSIGETTDIVTKEMYTFEDKKGRSLTLRPEGTAPMVRAYIEHSLDKTLPDPARLYYIGPMFRSERPQKGRSRQFHQIGVEVFGSASHYADAEVVGQMSNMLRLFGLRDFIIKLNSLGCMKDKTDFEKKLKDYLKDKKNRLCDNCKNRLKKNVLRILDCKDEACIQAARGAPNIASNLCRTCQQEFEKLKELLNNLEIKFEESKNLVRGLDYYTGTVFEVTHPALGGQDAVGAGGRYDNLVKDLGGSNISAVGYALGIERIILALKKEPPSSKNIVYLATIGDSAKFVGINMAEKIRSDLGITVLTDIKSASLKSQMRNADKNGAKIVLILGEDELKANKVKIHDMVKNEPEVLVDRDRVVEEIKKRI